MCNLFRNSSRRHYAQMRQLLRILALAPIQKLDVLGNVVDDSHVTASLTTPDIILLYGKVKTLVKCRLQVLCLQRAVAREDTKVVLFNEPVE